MNKVLCFGSLNIDHTYRVTHFVAAGETLAASAVQTFCGGKGLNQSVALGKAGAAVCHAGAIGQDGVWLLGALKEANVNTAFVTVLDDEKTGHAIIQNTADGENCILLFGGANRRITAAQVDAVLEHFSRGDLLVLQNEINLIPYLIERAKEKGMTVALTPAPINADVPAYPLSAVDYILLNETEAKSLAAFSKEEAISASDLADALCEVYPLVRFVLTMGSAGALYAHGKTRFFQRAFPVRAVDTTAAGDTFAGYFLQGILAGQTVETAMETAAKAAAICVTRRGASSSVPTREEVLAVRL